MSVYSIDIASLLASTFNGGFAGIYVVNEKDLAEAANTKYEIGTSDYAYPFAAADANGEGTNVLGLPVLQKITLSSTTSGGSSYDLGDCLVTIDMPRRIVRTPMQGQDEDVLEFISNGNKEINVKGFLISSNPYQAPVDQMRLFHTWFHDKKESLGVTGKIFDALKIHRMVVEHSSLGVIPGMINVRPFELKCISDLDYSLQIMQNA